MTTLSSLTQESTKKKPTVPFCLSLGAAKGNLTDGNLNAEGWKDRVFKGVEAWNEICEDGLYQCR